MNHYIIDLLVTMKNHPTLSFCITCKNRFHQISRTLRQNLDDNRMHQKQIEFLLVDFGSTDGLNEWVVSNFRDDLTSGYLRYFYTDELRYWHASIAKNTAHLLAWNEILVNLDGDNYTGHQGGQFVIDRFVNNRMDIVLHQFGEDLYDGSYGRISVLKKYFHSVGGYDEQFEPMGYQDRDLFERLKAAGLSYINASNRRYTKALANSKEDGIANTGSSRGFIDMLCINENKSKQNVRKGCLVANNGIYGIRKNLYDHQGKSYEIDPDYISRFSQVKFPSNHIQINASVCSIPKIIHQVWGGIIPLPDIYSLLAETWKGDYPGYQYIYWDDDRMNQFVMEYYPQYMDMYCNFPYHVQRWDAVRYLILYKIGGMYVDFDYESIEPLDKLVKDRTCCFAMEPESHCRIFEKSLMFNNALMLSIPGHPFIKKVIETVFSKSMQKSVMNEAATYSDEKYRKNHIVLHSTGPWMLMNLYEQLPENEKKNLYLIPDKYVTPFDADQAQSVVMGVETDELNECLAEAYAVHYFLGLWKNDQI